MAWIIQRLGRKIRKGGRFRGNSIFVIQGIAA